MQENILGLAGRYGRTSVGASLRFRLLLVVGACLCCRLVASAVPVPAGSDPAEEKSSSLSVASPESQGVDSARLAEAYESAASLRPLLSLLVVRNNRLIKEQYFHDATQDTACNIKSVSKSILSALTGIALREGFIKSLDEPLSKLLPEYFEPVEDTQKGWAHLRVETDPMRRKVTLRQLLTHTTGFIWDENQLLFGAWLWSSDYLRFFFELPMFSEPGEKFVYNTGGTHVLSAILARASGLTTLEFADRYLFGPTGMEIKRWDRAPEGTYIGGAEMHFVARDLAKFGLLYLNQGRQENRQIIPEDWVKESTAEHVKANYETPKTVEMPESWVWPFLQPGHFTGYGYLWWRRESAGYETYVALGYGGQFIFVIPELNTLLVATSAWDQKINPNRMAHYASFFKIVDTQIIPAISAGQGK